MGVLPQGMINIGIPYQWSFLSEPTPQSQGVNDFGLSPHDNDKIIFWDRLAQAWGEQYTYFDVSPNPGSGWYDSMLNNLVNPTPVVGEALIYYSNELSTKTWKREFSVWP